MPSAGDLRTRVVLQRSVEQPDGQGGTTTVWTSVATIWAQVMPGEGREFWARKALNAAISHTITMRYRTDLSSAWRIQVGARLFQIIGAPVDLDERHEFTQLICEERSSA